MAVNSSLTFCVVFALVSKKSRFASLAYASASAVDIARLSGCSVTKSNLFPARAMMMFSFAWRCNSLTHDFALSNDDCALISTMACYQCSSTYGLSNVVYNHGAVCISVVHRGQALVPFLSSSVPDLKLDGCVIIESNGLCEECGTNG